MHGEDDDGALDDDGSTEDGPMRGWVPPDDRLWLHPSERAAAARTGAPEPPIATAPLPLGRSAPRGSWVIGGLSVCVLVALAVSVLAVADANDSGHTTPIGEAFSGVPTTEVDLSHLTDTRRMVTVASSARESTVAVVVVRPTGTTVATGVVAEAGGIVVALRSAVSGARSITVVEPDGTRQSAVRVADDDATGIVVLRIADDLPVAPFSDSDPATGSVAVAMSEASSSTGGAPSARLYAGTVLYSGVSSGSGFCETAVAAPLSTRDLGAPLVESSGAVAGILFAVDGSGSGRTAAFLPAELVRDVTGQLVSHGSVDHGSLEADVTDPPPSTPAGTTVPGALVSAVPAGGSAAQAGLVRGDRIVSLGSAQVRSAAELMTRLYADPPGAELPVTFVRDGATRHTTVVLADR